MRREEILDATVAQVHQRGFASTRVSDVAQALGISSGLVFYHFGTKERLLADALAYAASTDLGRLDKALTRAKSPVDALRRVLALYRPASTSPSWSIWVDAWAEALRSPEMREACRVVDTRWREVLQQIIRDGVRSGDFTCDDPVRTAGSLYGLLDGLAVQMVVNRSLSPRQVAEWTNEAAAAALGIPVARLA